MSRQIHSSVILSMQISALFESNNIMCNSTASCLCNDSSNNAVRTVCSGPSTAPCVCSAESCTVSTQLQ